MIKLNMTTAKEMEPVPAGTYEVVIDSIKAKDVEDKDKATGEVRKVPSVAVLFVIASGPEAGKKLFNTYRITEDTQFLFTKLVKAVVPEADLEDEEFELEVEDMKGSVLALTLSLTSYKNSSGEDVPVNRFVSYAPLN